MSLRTMSMLFQRVNINRRFAVNRQVPVRSRHRQASTARPFDPEAVKVPVHKETPRFPKEYSTDGPPYGKIFDKKPFKMKLTEGKVYYWCACGHSKHQPLCDGQHKKLWENTHIKHMPRYRPIAFQVEETKEYWLCNCKQSAKRPYCDGTHKREDIQAAIRQ